MVFGEGVRVCIEMLEKEFKRGSFGKKVYKKEFSQNNCREERRSSDVRETPEFVC